MRASWHGRETSRTVALAGMALPDHDDLRYRWATARLDQLLAQGESRAILQVFDAIHRGNADPKLLAYQYLQTLPKIANGTSSKNRSGASVGSGAQSNFQVPLRSWQLADALRSFASASCTEPNGMSVA